jgi:hypothetical protein
MKSQIFHTNAYQDIQNQVKRLINENPNFLSPDTISPRAVGDAIERIIKSKLEGLLDCLCTEYSQNFKRRAMADFAFKDADGLYYMVDVKTHQSGTEFNMPNLTSVKRLAGFYRNDQNFFTILLVRYKVEELSVRASEVIFAPIESFDWQCLRIGALGEGQIQIKNTNQIVLSHENSRKQWMLRLCNELLDFYKKEDAKIRKRTARFEEERQFWEEKPE